ACRGDGRGEGEPAPGADDRPDVRGGRGLRVHRVPGGRGDLERRHGRIRRRGRRPAGRKVTRARTRALPNDRAGSQEGESAMHDSKLKSMPALLVLKEDHHNIKELLEKYV